METLPLPTKIKKLSENHVNAKTLNFDINNISINLTFPPYMITDTREETDVIFKKKIMEATQYSIRTTCRRENICMLSQKTYDENDEDFLGYRFPGILDFTYSFSIGQINYHKDFEDRLPYFRACFETSENNYYISKHSLQGQKINILRSCGKIEEKLIKDDSLMIVNRKDNLVLKFYVEDGLEKKVGFKDEVSSKSGKLYKGLISVNSELFDEDFVFKIGIEKLDKNLFDHERQLWKEKIIECLEEIGLKYEFYYY